MWNVHSMWKISLKDVHSMWKISVSAQRVDVTNQCISDCKMYKACGMVESTYAVTIECTQRVELLN